MHDPGQEPSVMSESPCKCDLEAGAANCPEHGPHAGQKTQPSPGDRVRWLRADGFGTLGTVKSIGSDGAPWIDWDDETITVACRPHLYERMEPELPSTVMYGVCSMCGKNKGPLWAMRGGEFCRDCAKERQPKLQTCPYGSGPVGAPTRCVKDVGHDGDHDLQSQFQHCAAVHPENGRTCDKRAGHDGEHEHDTGGARWVWQSPLDEDAEFQKLPAWWRNRWTLLEAERDALRAENAKLRDMLRTAGVSLDRIAHAVEEIQRHV